MFSCEYCEIFTNNFCYRTPLITSFDLHLLIKNNVGWFLLKWFLDLLLPYFHIIRRNHFNTLLLINLQKTKTCPSKALQQSLFVLISGFWRCGQVFVHYLMSILMMSKKTRAYIYQVASKEFPFSATCSEKE